MAQVNVRNRKRSDGSNNWEYRFEIARIGDKRKRISKSGYRTKAEALKEGIKAYEEYNNSGVTIKPSEISVADYMDLFINSYCKAELQESTVEGYIKIINTYIKPKIGHYKLKSLSPVIVQELYNEMKNNGYSRSSIIKIHTVICSSLNYAVTPLQYIRSSPAINVKVPKESEFQTVRKESGGIRTDGKTNGAVLGNNANVFLPKEQINQIFERFPLDHPDHIPLMTGYTLGARLGEVYALTVDDFDFENKTVNINKQVQWRSSTQRWYFKVPKYKSNRIISMSDNYAKLIKNKIEQIEKDKEYFGNLYTKLYVNDKQEINDAGEGKEIRLINIRSDGTFIQPRTMQHCSRIIHYQLGIKDFTFHSLRHTHATELAKANASIKFVQHRLGHKSIKVTLEIYQHIDAEMERDQAEILNLL